MNFLDFLFLLYIFFSLLKPVKTGDFTYSIRLKLLVVLSAYLAFITFTHPLILLYLLKVFPDPGTTYLVSYITAFIIYMFLSFYLIKLLAKLVYMVPLPFFSNIAAGLFSVVTSFMLIFIFAVIFSSFAFINKANFWQKSYFVQKSNDIERKHSIKKSFSDLEKLHLDAYKKKVDKAK